MEWDMSHNEYINSLTEEEFKEYLIDEIPVMLKATAHEIEYYRKQGMSDEEIANKLERG